MSSFFTHIIKLRLKYLSALPAPWCLSHQGCGKPHRKEVIRNVL